MDEMNGPNRFELAVLGGLQDRPIYSGTVHPNEVWERRQAGKRARKARRITRRRQVGK